MNSTLNRRKFIALVGGGAVSISLAQHAGTAHANYPEAAVQAWKPIDPNSEIRRWMLLHGLLAPNPHNRQPWIADLRKDGEITLICDAERLLPETDPYGRQILIGCGAFVELATLAAAQRGVNVAVQMFPNGEPPIGELPKGTVFARLTLNNAAPVQKDPLYPLIFKRHTNKSLYSNTRVISAADWSELTQVAAVTGHLADYVADAPRREVIKTITREAYEIELTTPRTYLESAKLFRIGPKEIETHRDGISITGVMPRILSTLGLFKPLEVPVKGSSAYKQVMDRWLPFESGSGYLWMATNGNTRKQQLEIGRAYVRAHLRATALGIDMHPLSQAVQEFAEISSLNKNLHRALNLDPQKQTLQMLVRVGYGANAAQGSPRRSLDSGMVITNKS